MLGFYGMGLLGSNFSRAFRRRGENVQVWNRTSAKAQALAAETGARAFDDPADAARGATRIHLSLSDDAAVDDVLERARPAAGTVIVDHTTTSAKGTLARLERWRARGCTFVHAPVFMGPDNARESTGLMLVSGARADVEPVKPELAKMTGSLVDLGDRPDEAAAMKLLGNCFLMFVTSGLADFIALARAQGLAPERALTLFDHFNPGSTIASRAARMLDDSAPVSWQLTMARKDARLMLEAAPDLHVLPAIARRMDDVIAAGDGAEDWTVVGRR